MEGVHVDVLGIGIDAEVVVAEGDDEAVLWVVEEVTGLLVNEEADVDAGAVFPNTFTEPLSDSMTSLDPELGFSVGMFTGFVVEAVDESEVSWDSMDTGIEDVL